MAGGVVARRSCTHCYTRGGNGSSRSGHYMGLEFVQVEEGAAGLVVAVVGEVAAGEPLAGRAGLDASGHVGRVGVDEEGGHARCLVLHGASVARSEVGRVVIGHPLRGGDHDALCSPVVLSASV